tara:strand:- start:1766 stop:1870 length:105 start_codon:yes stop_codon:yes gene_type:complete
MKFSTIVIKTMLENEKDEEKRKKIIAMIYRIINS